MKIDIDKKYNIRRLQQWLDYELSTVVLIVLSYMWGFTLFLAITAAIIFTPYMLFILFQERRFGWITFFFCFIILPELGILFIGETPYKSLIALIPLGLFYFYCFLLRLAVKDW